MRQAESIDVTFDLVLYISKLPGLLTEGFLERVPPVVITYTVFSGLPCVLESNVECPGSLDARNLSQPDGSAGHVMFFFHHIVLTYLFSQVLFV
jgi:hypothetical protein